MLESGYYPSGAEYDIKAPYNEIETPEKEIEVCVSITLSKTVKIKVSDYVIESGTDEDGEHFEDIDYSNCDLKKAVEEQITLPQNACIHMIPQTKACKDLAGWNVDDMEVILE